MASKSKAQKLDLEVEKALEQALDIDFGDDLDIDMDLSAFDESFSVDDLEEQISRAAEELVAEQKTKAADPAKVASAAIETRVAPIVSASVIATPAAPPVPPVVKAAPAIQQIVANTPHKPTPVKPDTTQAAPSPQLADVPEAPEAILRPVAPAATVSVATPAARTPANDDSRNDRAIATAPRRVTERSSKLYWTTTAISVLWAAGGVALSKAIDPTVFSSLEATKNFFTSPAGIGVVAGVALPVAMFWGFAQLVKRAQEMHNAARSMSEAAMKLLQPEAVSADRVSTLSQAVRREVAAMNEGIERTLARAVELETLVQSEVNQLERAYSDNEVRIRSLVGDLGNEREAVVSHAERVRSSISGAHEQLKEELSSASNIIRDNVLSASQQLSSLLSESGERLIGSINESGSSIAEAIETRTGDIGSRITTSGEAFANLLDTRIATLDEQSRTISERFTTALDERAAGIANLLGSSTESMVSEFDTPCFPSSRLAPTHSTAAQRSSTPLWKHARAKSTKTSSPARVKSPRPSPAVALRSAR
jgi:hypothetical protein